MHIIRWKIPHPLPLKEKLSISALIENFVLKTSSSFQYTMHASSIENHFIVKVIENFPYNTNTLIPPPYFSYLPFLRDSRKFCVVENWLIWITAFPGLFINSHFAFSPLLLQTSSSPKRKKKKGDAHTKQGGKTVQMAINLI